jgi:hypothetical protein
MILTHVPRLVEGRTLARGLLLAARGGGSSK